MSIITLEIMQLADSCFPSGGFAFSNGLECLAKLGYIKSMSDFHQYLECYLEQLTTSELPFLNSAYAAISGEASDCNFGTDPEIDSDLDSNRDLDSGRSSQKFLTQQFVEVAQDWNAWLFLPAQRRGSLAQGQAWLRTIEETYATRELQSLRKKFLVQDCSLHMLMVLAATLKIVGVSLKESQNLLIHMALRDQLGAAVRLGLLGSLQAQKLHHQFISIGERFRKTHEDWTCELAQRTSPMIELAQASHANLYSRLFQS